MLENLKNQKLYLLKILVSELSERIDLQFHTTL